MKRCEYERRITRQLNQIEGQGDYWFHLMTCKEIEEKFVAAVKDAMETLNANYTDDPKEDIVKFDEAKTKFARIAAMCMIAMDTADLKKVIALRHVTDVTE